MNDVRYGIYLRPDARTCWTIAQITTALRHQFGLRSADAFPPHATLVGNLKSEAGVDELVAVLDPVFEATEPFTVYNRGVRRWPTGVDYNVDLDATGEGVNEPLHAVAATVRAAVLPLSVPAQDHLVTPVEEYEFSGHLGLASHELQVDDRLAAEVGDFIDELDLRPPATFTARWYTLYEFRADWDGPWWENLTWRHLQSWNTVDQTPRVVVFDLGEVLASPADLHERLAESIGCDPSAEERAYWNHRDEYDRGGSSADFWGHVLTELEVTGSPALLEELTRLDTDAWVTIRDDATVLLQTLHATGTPIAILSNATPEMAAAARRTPWAPWISHWFFSSELGMAKPDPALYRHVQGVLDVPGRTITFLDDRQVNVDGAKAAGWDAHLWTSGDQALQVLVEAGLLPRPPS